MEMQIESQDSYRIVSGSTTIIQVENTGRITIGQATADGLNLQAPSEVNSESQAATLTQV